MLIMCTGFEKHAELRAVGGEGEAWQVMLMYLEGSGVIGSVSAHILPAWLRARQVLSGCGDGVEEEG